MFTLKGKSVLVLGDSIMAGSGNHEYGPGEYLRDELGATLYKYCIGGARTGYFEGRSWVVDKLKDAIEDGVDPDNILFDGMTNDCYKTDGEHYDVEIGDMPQGFFQYDLNAIKKTDTYSVCLDAIIYTLMSKYPKAKILYIRTHNMGRRTDEGQRMYGERAVSLCKKWGIPYVDLYHESGLNTFIPAHRDLYTADSYNWGIGDSTHPNDLGYRTKYMPLIISKLKTL